MSPRCKHLCQRHTLDKSYAYRVYHGSLQLMQAPCGGKPWLKASVTCFFFSWPLRWEGGGCSCRGRASPKKGFLFSRDNNNHISTEQTLACHSLLRFCVVVIEARMDAQHLILVPWGPLLSLTSMANALFRRNDPQKRKWKWKIINEKKPIQIRTVNQWLFITVPAGSNQYRKWWSKWPAYILYLINVHGT